MTFLPPHVSRSPEPDGNWVLLQCVYREGVGSLRMMAWKAAYSGNVIFCRLEKKSDLIIVDAERMLPDLLTTIRVTSFGSAIPLISSIRRRGFKASIPSSNNSF